MPRELEKSRQSGKPMTLESKAPHLKSRCRLEPRGLGLDVLVFSHRGSEIQGLRALGFKVLGLRV